MIAVLEPLAARQGAAGAVSGEELEQQVGAGCSAALAGSSSDEEALAWSAGGEGGVPGAPEDRECAEDMLHHAPLPTPQPKVRACGPAISDGGGLRQPPSAAGGAGGQGWPLQLQRK